MTHDQLVCSEGKCLLSTADYSEGDVCPNQDTLLHEGKDVRLEKQRIDEEFARRLKEEIEKFDAEAFISAEHKEGKFPPQEIAYRILMHYGADRNLGEIKVGKAHHLLKIATESDMIEVATDDHNQREIVVEEPWRICGYCGDIFDTHKGRRIHEGKTHEKMCSLQDLLEAAKDE